MNRRFLGALLLLSAVGCSKPAETEQSASNDNVETPTAAATPQGDAAAVNATAVATHTVVVKVPGMD